MAMAIFLALVHSGRKPPSSAALSAYPNSSDLELTDCPLSKATSRPVAATEIVYGPRTNE